MIRVGILTISTMGARGEREDTSGDAIREMVIAELEGEIARYQIVPDDREQIEEVLRRWSDEEKLELILSTGGTGFGPYDVTPEATEAVIERRAPALVIAMLMKGIEMTPHAMLTRAVAGIRGSTLIVNLPGSPKAVRENLEVILPALPHGIELLKDVQGAAEGHDYEGDA